MSKMIKEQVPVILHPCEYRSDNDSQIFIARDDLFPGGTKARFFPMLFRGRDEIVYASPGEGGAQTAMATVAARLGKRATIFTAARAEPHPRTRMVQRLGAQVFFVRPGYLTVVQARAREYASKKKAYLVPFGADVPEAIDVIVQAALTLPFVPSEVWCAAGSGVLARGLAKAFPKASRHVVQVGRELTPNDVAGAHIWKYPSRFDQHAKTVPEFPSDRHYDAKAWEVCVEQSGAQARFHRSVLFWNVAGPALCD